MLTTGLYLNRRFALSIRYVLAIVLILISALVIADFLRPNEVIQTTHSAMVPIINPTILGMTRISSAFVGYLISKLYHARILVVKGRRKGLVNSMIL